MILKGQGRQELNMEEKWEGDKTEVTWGHRSIKDPRQPRGRCGRDPARCPPLHRTPIHGTQPASATPPPPLENGEEPYEPTAGDWGRLVAGRWSSAPSGRLADGGPQRDGGPAARPEYCPDRLAFIQHRQPLNHHTISSEICRPMFQKAAFTSSRRINPGRPEAMALNPCLMTCRAQYVYELLQVTKHAIMVHGTH